MNTFKTINAKTLKQAYDNDHHLSIIDVRELDEWQSGHIEGAIHLPKDQIVDHIEQYIKDKQQPIYLHCLKGMRSAYAAQCLVNLGYQQVYSLEGGIAAWASLGYPIVKP